MVAELDLGPEAARAGPVDRPVHHDPVQPRRERASPVESVEIANGGEEGLLGDVLGGGGVARDEACSAERPRPMFAKEQLEVGDRPLLGTLDPGALRHPPNLRWQTVTRSIRAGDLHGSRGRKEGV